MIHGKSLMVFADSQSLTIESMEEDADFKIVCFDTEKS